MNWTIIVFGWSLLASGCAIRCKEETFHRYEATGPGTDITATALMNGGIRLETKAGAVLDLSSCRPLDRAKNEQICVEIRLPEEHRFRFLATEFIALWPYGKPTTRLKIDPVNYSTHCVVRHPTRSPFSNQETPVTLIASCPAEQSSINGFVQVEEKAHFLSDRSMISRYYTFDPSLEFRGAEGRSYRTIVFRDLHLGSDFILVPPPIAIDGKEVALPRISVKTVKDKLCHVRELM